MGRRIDRIECSGCRFGCRHAGRSESGNRVYITGRAENENGNSCYNSSIMSIAEIPAGSLEDGYFGLCCEPSLKCGLATIGSESLRSHFGTMRAQVAPLFPQDSG
jgi:hypothetical protein